MSAYYNENDPFAAAWLRELIKAGQVAPGEVDERDIQDIRPVELMGFTQCHFFAGIGVWSYALRQAGWPDDHPVWTGSCPCQPFSAAGKRKGTADERHLWPAFFHLISQCHPATLFGEQVASKDGLSWLDTVLADLESEGYASWAWDLCAAGFGAPHIRQRLYFVGTVDNSSNPRYDSTRQCDSGSSLLTARPEQSGVVGDMADPEYTRRQGRLSGGSDQGREDLLRHCGSSTGNLDNPPVQGLEKRTGREVFGREARGQSERSGNSSFWEAHDQIWCIDGRTRPVEPGTFPLAHGAPSRVGRLRGYGNALCAPVAQGFIEAVMEIIG